jgi:hypothetical protein
MTEHRINGGGGHILFDGHGHDARFNGPLSVSPTVSAAYGEGGGNIPLVLCPAPFHGAPTDISTEGEAKCHTSTYPKTSRK